VKKTRQEYEDLAEAAGVVESAMRASEEAPLDRMTAAESAVEDAISEELAPALRGVLCNKRPR
jgi:hypothetical protein